jgi:drug/metabolite transporter (DMT)-like permease
MTETTSGTRGRVHRAGAFDIRNFIGALIGLYGIVLVIYGIVGSSAAQLKKSDQVNINLWAGIGMVVVAVFFVTWARLRPVVVPEDPEAVEDDPTSSR